MLHRIACLLLVTGCAASPPPSAADASQPQSSTQERGEGSDGAQAKTSASSQHDAFMKGCLENTTSTEYCECAFVQYVDVFRDVDLSKGVAKNDPLFGRLGEQTKTKCADKFPEEEAKKAFLGSCSAKDPKQESYCTCAWGELRKTLSVADVINYQESDPKWVQAKLQLPKGCKGKYPAELARNEFIAECQSDGTTDKQCQCLWGKISKKFTIEEIVVGTADVAQVPGLDKCK